MELPERTANVLQVPIPFKTVKEAGTGGYSVVYHVKDQATGKNYALKKINMKQLSKANMENIVKEVKSHSQMEHSHIIKMVDHLKDGDIIYLLLDYADNGNLFNYMNKVEMNHSVACKIFVQICLAIEYIHSKGYIHRDLKPENIFLDNNMNSVLGDFGWCAHVSDTTYRYQTAGTYEYMAPEALKGKIQGREVDLWALGILLYELFHNQEPFPGRSSKEVLNSIQTKAVEFFTDVPKEATELIVKILAIDPKKRPSIREILDHPFIKKYYKESIPPAPSGVENYPQSPTHSRNASPVRNLFSSTSSGGMSPTLNRLAMGKKEENLSRKISIESPTELKERAIPSIIQNRLANQIGNPQPTDYPVKQLTLINHPGAGSQKIISSGDKIDKSPTNLVISSMRSMTDALSKDSSPTTPNRLEFKSKFGSQAKANLVQEIPEITTPTRIVGMPTTLTRQHTGSDASCRSIAEHHPIRLAGTLAADLASNASNSPQKIVSISSVNGRPGLKTTVQTTNFPAKTTPPVMSTNQPVFSFGKVEEKPKESVDLPSPLRGSFAQTSIPKVVISSSNKTQVLHNTNDLKDKISSVRDVQPLQISEVRKLGSPTVVGKLTIGTTNMMSKPEPTTVTATSPLANNIIKPLKLGETLSPRVTPLNINAPRKTLPLESNSSGTIAFNNKLETRFPVTERAALPMKRDAPQGGLTLLNSPLREIIGPAQVSRLPSDIYGRDSKTIGSTSTEESKRVILDYPRQELKNQIVISSAARQGTKFENRVIDNSNNSLAQNSYSNQQNNLEKRSLLGRRTSDGFVKNGNASPKKDSINHTGVIRHLKDQPESRGMQRSSAETANIVRDYKPYSVYTAKNENMGSPLLRPSPAKNLPTTKVNDYSSFFMKKISSMDSNFSSEYDFTPQTHNISQGVRIRADTSKYSYGTTELSKAMTAIVVGGNSNATPSPAKQLSNQLTLIQPSMPLQQQAPSQPASLNMVSGSTAVPLYTIYKPSMTPSPAIAAPAPTQSSSIRSSYYIQGQVAADPLRGSMNINYAANPIGSNRGSYQIVSRPQTALNSQKTSFQTLPPGHYSFQK